MRSATPFCCGVPGTVKCLTIPSFWQTSKKGSDVYFPPLSDLSFLIFQSIWVSIIFFCIRKISNTSSLCFIVYTQTLLEKSSMNDTKALFGRAVGKSLQLMPKQLIAYNYEHKLISDFFLKHLLPPLKEQADF